MVIGGMCDGKCVWKESLGGLQKREAEGIALGPVGESMGKGRGEGGGGDEEWGVCCNRRSLEGCFR